jgi:hypothetical protein
LIVIAVLAAHISVIALPKDLILDEQHYVKDARYIMANHQTERPEHPPLAKLMILGGMLALGDNPWGWRTPVIIMSVIGVVLFYFICRRLQMSRTPASVATFLYSFENFIFMQKARLCWMYLRFSDSGGLFTICLASIFSPGFLRPGITKLLQFWLNHIYTLVIQLRKRSVWFVLQPFLPPFPL